MENDSTNQSTAIDNRRWSNQLDYFELTIRIKLRGFSKYKSGSRIMIIWSWILDTSTNKTGLKLFRSKEKNIRKCSLGALVKVWDRSDSRGLSFRDFCIRLRMPLYGPYDLVHKILYMRCFWTLDKISSLKFFAEETPSPTLIDQKRTPFVIDLYDVSVSPKVAWKIFVSFKFE